LKAPGRREIILPFFAHNMQQQSGMPPLSPTADARTTTVGQPSPISSRAPEPGSGGSAPPAGGSFEHEGPDEGDRSGSAGNRWPQEETLALLKIRSEMDAAFREAALKGPLWEEVSRYVVELAIDLDPVLQQLNFCSLGG
jgi:hypothetical protein